MGAKYAPSVANLVLAKWETENIYYKWPEMALYKRYIDDIILFWEGTIKVSKHFLKQLDRIDYDLGFTGEWSADQVNFLDLVLFKVEGKIHAKTHFKDTDQNNYIPTTSYHHKKWIYNTLSSQYSRIRRNCVLESDYINQTNINRKIFGQEF